MLSEWVIALAVIVTLNNNKPLLSAGAFVVYGIRVQYRRALVVYMIGGVIGIYLLIIDFILFLKKKPLVYPFEIQLFTKLYN